jgi:hypothetical protein
MDKTVARINHMRDVIIPHRLRAISFGKNAIELQEKFGYFQMVNIMVEMGNGSQTNELQCTMNTFAEPVISTAIIYSRCLLEFFGLGITRTNPPKMKKKDTRKNPSDMSIEDYEFEYFTPESAIELLGRSEDADNLNRAWAKTYAIANQRLAHSTTDEILAGSKQDDSIKLTFESVPELICRALYDRLNQDRPNIM